MVYAMFPDPLVVPLSVGKGGGPVYAAFGQMAGAPLHLAGIYQRMMFVRLAMIGDWTAPTVFLRAGQGPAVAFTTVTQPIFRATAANGSGTDFVGDVYRVPGQSRTVQILVGLEQATTDTWALGIRNNDPEEDRQFVWVVADNDAETLGPGLDPASFVPAFAEPPAPQFTPVRGAPGTRVTLFGRNLHIGSPKIFFGTEPVALLGPPTPTALTVFVREGLITPERLVVNVPLRVKTDAGAAVSDTVFHVEPPQPGFTAPPVTPLFCRPGQNVILHGRNLDYGPVQVGIFFQGLGLVPGVAGAGTFPVASPHPTEIGFQMPEDFFRNEIDPGAFPLAFRFAVTTAGGQAECPCSLIMIL